MRRFFAGTAAALLAAVLFVPVKASAVSAQSAAVMDPVSGRLLFDKNSSKQSLIASTTKIMTALLICERCNVLDQMRIPKEAVGIEGSSMYLREGEKLTLQELLYGLMLSSGNDAAVALALGTEPGNCVGFFTTDTLSDLFAMVVVSLAGRLDGVFEDQKTYLRRLQAQQKKEKGGF